MNESGSSIHYTYWLDLRLNRGIHVLHTVSYWCRETSQMKTDELRLNFGVKWTRPWNEKKPRAPSPLARCEARRRSRLADRTFPSRSVSRPRSSSSHVEVHELNVKGTFETKTFSSIHFFKVFETVRLTSSHVCSRFFFLF